MSGETAPCGANPARGETVVTIAGQPRLLRPSFDALVRAEEELGPLLALVERAGEGQLRLAEIAGLSRSRFAEMFLTSVGEPPAAYLRRWRLTLARQDVDKGHRVDAIARRYGYGSAEGFTRAFRKQFGALPIELRHRQAE